MASEDMWYQTDFHGNCKGKRTKVRKYTLNLNHTVLEQRKRNSLFKA